MRRCKHLKHNLRFVRNIYGDEINELHGARSEWECPDCGKTILRPDLFTQGEEFDGYHTFNELYHHRTVLFATICNQNPEIAWKSKCHDGPGGPMYQNMFIAGIETPSGQATYHCDLEPYWEFFKVKELDKAPEWDGHTSAEAIRRIKELT